MSHDVKENEVMEYLEKEAMSVLHRDLTENDP